MVSKQVLFILAIVFVFFLIIGLTYFQIIIWNEGLILVLAVLCIIVAIILFFAWWWSRRKKGPIRIGKDLEMTASENTAKKFWGLKGISLKFPSTHYCYGEERFDEDGNRYHGFAGMAFTRVKQIGTGEDMRIEPINPHNRKEIGRCITVINATEKRVVDWYIKPYQDQYEDLWKRLGIVSASRKPSIVTRIKEVSPITGVEKEAVTAPIGSPEVQPTEGKVV